MNKTLFLPLLAIFIFSSAGPRPVSGQAPAAGGNPSVAEPIHITIERADGKRQVRESRHDGAFDPIAIPAGEQVNITLRFLPNRGETLTGIVALDGGELTLPQVREISAGNTFTFQFRSGPVPGSYRLLIRAVREYEVTLYTYDKSIAPGGPR